MNPGKSTTKNVTQKSKGLTEGERTSIKARVQDRFNVSIAECDNHDLWQRATLGVSQVGTDEAHVDGCLRAVVKFIDGLNLAELGEERFEFLHY